MQAEADTRFADGKDADALRTIGEVSKALGIKPHVLRYWEQQFPMLKPLKRSGGRRYYRPEDVRLLDSIDQLVNRQGFTLKGAKQALLKGVESLSNAKPAAADPIPSRVKVDAEIVQQLRAIRDRLSSALD